VRPYKDTRGLIRRVRDSLLAMTTGLCAGKSPLPVNMGICKAWYLYRNPSAHFLLHSVTPLPRDLICDWFAAGVYYTLFFLCEDAEYSPFYVPPKARFLSVMLYAFFSTGGVVTFLGNSSKER